MAPFDRDQRYDPVPPIPTYDEAIAGSSSRTAFDADEHLSGADAAELEAHALLFDEPPTTSASRSRRAGGYRPPTVETDDEDSLWSSESDDDGDNDRETAQVRREMQELEILDPSDAERSHLSSIFGKSIGFPISLNWRWKWRWRWPVLPKLRIRLPDGPEGAAEPGDDARRQQQQQRRWRRCAWSLPSMNASAAFIIVGRLLAVTLVLGFVYLLFMSDVFSNMSRRLGGQVYDPESVRRHIQSSVDTDKMRDHLQHFTQYAHMAGTEGDYALAEDVKILFEQYGLEDVSVDEYYVYLNYPKAGGRAVQILGPDKDDKKPIWSAIIEEDEVGRETRGHQTLVFHGHSKSGDVRGPLIYANYGSREDFKRLYDSGIDTKGAIALVRYYGSQSDRALKVKAAEMAGFAGCIMYSDPADDGYLRGEPAPDGRMMPKDGVQRGAVSLMSYVVGDVLTPGWESKKGLPRIKPDKSPGLVQIPSIPLAWRDAQVLLQHLRGFGEKVPPEWEGGVPEVGEWWSGNASSPVVRLRNEQDEVEQQPIWNVYGRIVGVEQEAKSVVIGNHRDSWTFGATDPHSGTAVMLEMVRIFGDLLRRGWRPLRTIEFMSWDAEEYNLIGSTEYVENNLDRLRADGVAYINLDTAVTGPEFHAAGSPVFDRLLLQILKRVADPIQNATLRELWDQRNARLDGLGAGSDYVAFQDIAGTSSLDIHFDGQGTPHHSSYDTFDWMDRVGDRGFIYHGLLGQVLGLLIVELADRPILPLDIVGYGSSLERWVDDLIQWTENKGANRPGDTPLDMSVLKFATNVIVAAARKFEAWEASWESSVLSASGWEPIGLGRQRAEYNSRMAQFETNLLDLEFGGGIPNRTQFKHVVFGPQLWSSYDEAYFPAIRDVIESGNWTLANITVNKVATIMQKAAAELLA